MSTLYAAHEDIASAVSFCEEADALQSRLPLMFLEIFGPGADACVRHEKAAMVRFGTGAARQDVFMDAGLARRLVDEVLAAKRALSLRPVVFSVAMFFGKAEMKFIVDKRSFRGLFRSADLLREALLACEASRAAEQSDPPLREGPPLREDMEALQKIYAWSAKPEPNNIGLEGIDESLFLALLYNNAKPGGDEIWSNRGGEMLPAEGRHLFAEMQRLGAPSNFDSINSRPIQTCFGWADGKRVLSVSNYWGQTGTPVVALIPLARKGIYTEVLGKGFRNYKEETLHHCSLLFSLSQKLGHAIPADQIVEELDRIMARCVTEKTVRDCLGEQEEAYQEYLGKSRTDRPYQVSLFHFSPKEIGHAVKPFRPKPSMRLIKAAAAPQP